jgi:natural product precursor
MKQPGVAFGGNRGEGEKEISSVTSQLSDEELDALAGGWTCWIGCVSEISEYRWMLAQFGKDKLL